MENKLTLHYRIERLKSEIYILLIDELFLDYSVAETVLEDNLCITGRKSNPETIKKINHNFLQIKNLQLLLKIS
jgi:hypothetical protein